MRERLDAASLAALSVTLVLWASAFVGIRAALTAYSPGHLALLRFLAASAAVACYALATRMRLPEVRDLPMIVLQGFIGYFVYHVALNTGEQTVSAASASFLIGFIPVFTTLLSAAFLGERLTGRALAGIIMSLTGVLIISLAEGGGARFGTGAPLVLLSALASSVFFVIQKPYLNKYRPVEYTIWCMWAGTACMLVFLPGLAKAVADAPVRATLAVVYLGLFPAALAYAAWTFAMSRAPVSRVVMTQYAMPALTILIGWLWLGELPRPMALLGGLIALGGVLVVNTGLGRGWRLPRIPSKSI